MAGKKQDRVGMEAVNKRSRRLRELTKHITKEKQGIEIAPFFNPSISKSDGYNVLVVDISTTEHLRERARTSDHIPTERVDEIEEVDVVGDASRLADLLEGSDLAGKIDYIVSSHNFEHLPNPIKFLQGCEAVLAEGGIVSMAIPDYRACFDHHRFPTRLADWMRAYQQDFRSPDPYTILDYVMNKSTYHDALGVHDSGSIQAALPENYVVDRNVDRAVTLYEQQLKPDASYLDVHCTTTFGPAFELMIRDLAQIGLLNLEVMEVSDSLGHEFFVHLRKVHSAKQPEEVYYETREALQRAVHNGLGPNAFDRFRRGRKARPMRAGTAPHALMRHRLGAMLLGESGLAQVRAWNKKRRSG